jgi:acetylornithine deacetylase
MNSELEQRLIDYVDSNRERLVTLIGDLVRRRSENMPPHGDEAICQSYAAEVLLAAGWQPEIYELADVPGLLEHPMYAPEGREYAGRPNLGARRQGTGNGRSLSLSGHVDTVPRGTQPWTRDAFGGEVEGNRLYGRGSNDMKAGVATNLFIAEALTNLGIRLQGDLTVESVVDEEFGGVNGTIAGRVRGYLADAAVIGEPSSLRICAAQRGGRTVDITFRSEGGVLAKGKFPAGVIDQLTYFLSGLNAFAEQRRRTPAHPLYAACPDPVPVSVMKVFTAPWGSSEPMTVPEECKVELFWQTMPGESQEDIERQFQAWFDGLLAGAPHLFEQPPTVEFPIRWLPGSAIEVSEALVKELSACATQVLPEPPPVVGIEGPCDMFAFHQFKIPAVLWGVSGGNTHAADEYVDLDSAVAAAKALLLFVCRWCGVEE